MRSPRSSRTRTSVVYLDAGAGDALSYKTAARMLNSAGIHQAQGFFLQLHPLRLDHLGDLLRPEGSRCALHGVHFVVSTSDNGRGPLRPKDRVHHGNEILCVWSQGPRAGNQTHQRDRVRLC